MKNGTCLKCKSTDIRPLRTWTTADQQQLYVAEPKKGFKMWFESGFELYPLQSIACFKCGYVELYMAGFDETDHEEWKEANSPDNQ